MTTVFVGHGGAVETLTSIRNASRSMPGTLIIDMIDDSENPTFHGKKQRAMEDAFRNHNPVLVLGISEWSDVAGESNPGDTDAVHYTVADSMRYGATVKSCIVTDSLARLAKMPRLGHEDYKERDRVEIIVVYGHKEEKGAQAVYDKIMRTFPSLRRENLLRIPAITEEEALTIARHIRNLG